MSIDGGNQCNVVCGAWKGCKRMMNSIVGMKWSGCKIDVFSVMAVGAGTQALGLKVIKVHRVEPSLLVFLEDVCTE